MRYLGPDLDVDEEDIEDGERLHLEHRGWVSIL